MKATRLPLLLFSIALLLSSCKDEFGEQLNADPSAIKQSATKLLEKSTNADSTANQRRLGPDSLQTDPPPKNGGQW